MKKRTSLTMGLAAILCFSASAAYSASPPSVTVPMNMASPQGIGKSIGEVKIIETSKGLLFKPNLRDLPPGEHGFHIHEHPSCDAADMQAAMKAGGHWDPENKMRHAGPNGDGHRGDLPKLIVNAVGKTTGLTVNAQGKKVKILAPHIESLKEISGHTLMVHAGGDNYTDNPKLGGGGNRLACGVIPAAAN